jgi:hypothetical protein
MVDCFFIPLLFDGTASASIGYSWYSRVTQKISVSTSGAVRTALLLSRRATVYEPFLPFLLIPRNHNHSSSLTFTLNLSLFFASLVTHNF